MSIITGFEMISRMRKRERERERQINSIYVLLDEVFLDAFKMQLQFTFI